MGTKEKVEKYIFKVIITIIIASIIIKTGILILKYFKN
jgi:hypothetical protein